MSDFVGADRQGQKDSLDERITFETVKIDGPLAIAWTPINFIMPETSVIAESIHFNW